MRKVYAVAALALVFGGNVGAHDEEHESRPHTHWYLELDAAWYAGASFGQTTFNDWSAFARFPDASFTSRAEDKSDTGLRVFAGLDFWRYFALELGYADYGEAALRWQNDGTGSFWNAGPVTEAVELKAFDLELLGKLPLTENLALFGKAGSFSWKTKTRLTGDAQCCGFFDFKDGDSSYDLSYGAGVQYDGFRPFRVVAEYTAASINDSFSFKDRKVDSIALSLAYLLE